MDIKMSETNFLSELNWAERKLRVSNIEIEREGERYLDLNRRRRRIESISERSDSTDETKNRNRKGEQSVQSVTEWMHFDSIDEIEEKGNWERGV